MFISEKNSMSSIFKESLEYPMPHSACKNTVGFCHSPIDTCAGGGGVRAWVGVRAHMWGSARKNWQENDKNLATIGDF